MQVAYLMRRWAAYSVAFFVLLASVDAYAQNVPRPTKRGRKYRVKIDSAPQQAAVYLDDEKYGIVGYTPWNGRLQKGSWKVIVKKDGYKPETRQITVRRTRRVQETFVPMAPAEATLDVTAAADPNTVGAEIWVDGQNKGVVPSQVKVKDGRHLVEIKKAEFDPFKQWIEAKAGATITMNPVLKQNAVGSILVEADVPGADVYIDGNKHPDQTPTIIRDVSAGPHVVEVKKDPSLPWKQTVTVKANDTVKVSAGLKASSGGPSGKIRVLANMDDVEVFMDGSPVGKAPVDITDVSPGEHVLGGRLEGYQNAEERVAVSAGQTMVVKLTLRKRGGQGTGTIRVVSPVPEADVFLDGARIGTAPQTKKVSVGEHFVVVSKSGFSTHEEKVNVVAGQTLTISPRLTAAGSVRFLSNPNGAEIILDGVSIGKTPQVKKDIEAGEHQVQFKLGGFHDAVVAVNVTGGETVAARADLQSRKQSPRQLKRTQRGQSSFSAVPIARNKVNIDMYSGYPYYLGVNFHIGAGDIMKKPFDASLMLKSFFSRTDFAIRGRLNLVDHRPFAIGTFVELGGGGTLFTDAGQDTYFMRTGLLGSLTALGRVSITARFYLDIWTDRFCPGVSNGQFNGDASPDSRCVDYLNFREGRPSDLSQEKFDRTTELFGDDTDLFNRNTGVRFMTSLILELAIKQRWSLFLMVEGAPGQDERPAFTNSVSGAMFGQDPGTYFRLGTTYKF